MNNRRTISRRKLSPELRKALDRVWEIDRNQTILSDLRRSDEEQDDAADQDSSSRWSSGYWVGRTS